MRMTVSAVASRTAVAMLSLVSCAGMAGGDSIHTPQGGRWRAVADAEDHLLEDYVRIDTTNPPGDTTKAADLLGAVLTREGIRFTRYESAPGKAIILARLAATVTPVKGKPILLLHHMDVVPADKSRWAMDPFAAVVRDGTLWGRGSLDMKAIGVAELFAFLELKRLNVPRNRDVLLLADPDEETGGAHGARWMITNHWNELDPEYVLDEGGFGSNELFAPGKLVYGVVVAEKTIEWLKVRAEGEAGHGSMPEHQNANAHLVQALARLFAEPPALSEPPLVKTMAERVGPLADNKFTNAIQHSTISLTWLRSGVGDPPKINVIPSVAEAGLDCRLLPGIPADEWVAQVEQRLGDPSLKVETVFHSREIAATTTDTPLYRNLESAIRRRHPNAIVVPMLAPYGTDANAFRLHGAKSYGLFPAILPASSVLGIHGDDEHVPLAAVHEATQVYFEALRATLSE